MESYVTDETYKRALRNELETLQPKLSSLLNAHQLVHQFFFMRHSRDHFQTIMEGNGDRAADA